MLFLYWLNIISYLLTPLIAPCYFSRRFQLGPWNLLTIPLLVSTPIGFLTSFSGPYVFLADGLFNPYFQYALLVNNTYVATQALSLVFLTSQLQRNLFLARRLNRIVERSGEAQPQRMMLAAWIFLSLFVVSFLLLTQSFGLLNWIAHPRLGYQIGRAGAGPWFALATTFLSVSLALATVYVRSTHRILLLAPVYLALSYLLGSKGYSLAFAIFLIIVLVIRRYTYLKPVVFLIGLAAAGLVVSTFAAAAGSVDFQDVAQYSDYFVNAARYYKGYVAGDVPLFHGEVALTKLWSLVPRGLYPNKPYVYGDLLIDEIFYPGAAAQTNTPAFATVSSFSDFGWPQVFVSALLAPQNFVSALLYVVVLPNLQALNVRSTISNPRLVTYGFLMLAAPSFLLYFEFPLYQVMLVLIFGIIALTNRVRVYKMQEKENIPGPSDENQERL